MWGLPLKYLTLKPPLDFCKVLKHRGVTQPGVPKRIHVYLLTNPFNISLGLFSRWISRQSAHAHRVSHMCVVGNDIYIITVESAPPNRAANGLLVSRRRLYTFVSRCPRAKATAVVKSLRTVFDAQAHTEIHIRVNTHTNTHDGTHVVCMFMYTSAATATEV